MTKQTTIVVIGALRVKVMKYIMIFNVADSTNEHYHDYFFIMLWDVDTPANNIICVDTH